MPRPGAFGVLRGPHNGLLFIITFFCMSGAAYLVLGILASQAFLWKSVWAGFIDRRILY